MQSKRANRRSTNRSAEESAFTLIELLTVVFIIGLLIAILVPAINLARNAAKNAKTASLLKAVDTGLQMSKQDNEKYFRATNGYPPSFVHPVLKGYAGFSRAAANEGRFPFAGSSGSHPRVYGAHWLPFFLMGKDALGYIPPSSVRAALRDKPEEWYLPDPSDNAGPLERQALYVDRDTAPIKATSQLMGRSLDPGTAFPDWAAMKDLPVIVDSFGQAVLYYASNTFGKQTNMVEKEHLLDDDYADGRPFYFHQDNAGFTGNNDQSTDANGWDYSNKARTVNGKLKLHRIAEPGDESDPTGMSAEFETFALYILDRNAYKRAPQPVPANWPRLPVRSDSYLLITAGVDGLYGTNDDVTNLPAFEE